MHFSDLPILGVGLSGDLSSTKPDFRQFLGNSEDIIDYLSVGAHYVQRPRIQYYIDDLIRSDFPIVFHPINFNVALGSSEDETVVRGVKEIIEYTKAKWAGQDMDVWMYGNQYLGPFVIPAILDEQSIESVSEKVVYLNRSLPCPFLIENSPVSFSLERMHILDFMRSVSEEADCGIVLDIGHLIGYQQATGRAISDMPVERFPFDRVVEIHMSGLQFSKIGSETNFIDEHSYPIPEMCWSFLRKHVDRMTNLKGITLEQEYARNEIVLKHLRIARMITKELEVFDAH